MVMVITQGSAGIVDGICRRGEEGPGGRPDGVGGGGGERKVVTDDKANTRMGKCVEILRAFSSAGVTGRSCLTVGRLKCIFDFCCMPSLLEKIEALESAGLMAYVNDMGDVAIRVCGGDGGSGGGTPSLLCENNAGGGGDGDI